MSVWNSRHSTFIFQPDLSTYPLQIITSPRNQEVALHRGMSINYVVVAIRLMEIAGSAPHYFLAFLFYRVYLWSLDSTIFIIVVARGLSVNSHKISAV